jgi:hypothetical protein
MYIAKRQYYNKVSYATGYEQKGTISKWNEKSIGAAVRDPDKPTSRNEILTIADSPCNLKYISFRSLINCKKAYVT